MALNKGEPPWGTQLCGGATWTSLTHEEASQDLSCIRLRFVD